ncbi:MAG: hypothetical protein CL920_09225 [Deltaproteobacteria bacterium]|nr:hypothetical protein [Deltaproteobacteria bacterium]
MLLATPAWGFHPKPHDTSYRLCYAFGVGCRALLGERQCISPHFARADTERKIPSKFLQVATHPKNTTQTMREHRRVWGQRPQAGVGGKPTMPSGARQLQGQAERASKGKWQLAHAESGNSPKKHNTDDA